MTNAAPGEFPLPGVAMESWLLKFDCEGNCTSPATRAALIARLGQGDGASVILFSHGWNNDIADSTALYTKFLSRLEAHLALYFPALQRPIFVGVIWPSILLSSNQGPVIAAVRESSNESAAEEAQKHRMAAALADHEARDSFYRLLEEPGLSAQGAARLAALVSAALRQGAVEWEPEGAERSAPDRDDVLAGLEALQELEASHEQDYSDEGGTIGGPAVGEPQHAGFLTYLDPRWALRLATVYQMKDRAGTVGWRGVAPLVADILSRSQRRLHLVGHSYGAKVVLSAVAGGALSRPAQSVLLLQPAISHLSFAARVPSGGAGGYRGVPGQVAGSILTTYSGHDIPLHTIFHRALRRQADRGEARIAAEPASTGAGDPPSLYAAMGGFGPRGSGERLVGKLPEPGHPVPVASERGLASFDGTIGSQIAGHGDVATPHTAWLLACQCASNA